MKEYTQKLFRVLCFTLLCLFMLAGCGAKAEPQPIPPLAEGTTPPAATTQPEVFPSAEPSASPAVPDEPSPEPGASPAVPDEPSPEPGAPAATPDAPAGPGIPPAAPDELLSVSDRDAIKIELAEAIRQLRQPRSMDISAVHLENPELDVKNIYFEITAQNPELKYVYDVTSTVSEDKLTCTLHYMPYKTGAFPADFTGVEVPSLKVLLSIASENMGAESVSIRITDTSLDPDTMNRTLQQAGGGYIYCALNADATEIRYSTPFGMTMEECLTALESANQLADEVIARVITDDMSPYEKAEALYSYVTQNVTYDRRYYSDKAPMPYESQTALGALRDHLAICGGYSHAVKLLFEKAGIPCYNVTGRCFREHHMWNIAFLDGEWLWFDATADRGIPAESGFRHFALSTLDEEVYLWNEDDILQLLEETDSLFSSHKTDLADLIPFGNRRR